MTSDEIPASTPATHSELPQEGPRAMLVLLRDGTETEFDFPVNPPCVIGRFDPNVGPVDVELQNLPEGAYVSRKHACIACEDNVWTLEDLESSNGTFILRDDFERIDKDEIHDGDQIAFGSARFLFKTHAIDEHAPEDAEPEP